MEFFINNRDLSIITILLVFHKEIWRSIADIITTIITLQIKNSSISDKITTLSKIILMNSSANIISTSISLIQIRGRKITYLARVS